MKPVARQVIAIIVTLLLSEFAAGQAITFNIPERYPDQVCRNLELGGNQFMAFGPACDADRFGSVSRAQRLYRDYILSPHEWADRPTYYRRYLSRVFSLAQSVATSVYNQRATNPHPLEAAAFNKSFLALLGQESRFLHYRWSIRNQNILKFQVGDQYENSNTFHARGMSQVNVRFHELPTETLFDLSKNLTYAAGYYFKNWEVVKQSRCLSRITDTGTPSYWGTLSVAAYAAYNRNAGSACRSLKNVHEFKNVIEHHAKNSSQYHPADAGYLAHFILLSQDPVKRAALERSTSVPPLVDFEAIVNGADFLAKPAEAIDFKKHKVAYLDTGKVCRVEGQQLLCLDEKDESCLDAVTRSDLHKGLYVFAKEEGLSVVNLERNTQCEQNVPGLHPVGSIIYLKQKLSVLRREDGGEVGPRVPAGLYQILDFQVEYKGDHVISRRYKISHQGQTGFVYAGESIFPFPSGNLTDWTELVIRHTPTRDPKGFTVTPKGFAATATLDSSANHAPLHIPFAGSTVRLAPGTQNEVRVVVDSVRIEGNGQRVYITYKNGGPDVTKYIGDAGATETLFRNIAVESL